MFLQHPPGFIWLLAIIISHVIPAFWSQHIGKEHRAYNSSLYEYQHVFSGLWQFQLQQKGVHSRHFGKEGRHQISIHDNKSPQREKYDFSRLHHASSYGIFEYSFQDKASLYDKCQCNLQDIIISNTGQLGSPTTAEPLEQQQRRQLVPNTVFHNDIA